jgi:hypothetical protein
MRAGDALAAVLAGTGWQALVTPAGEVLIARAPGAGRQPATGLVTGRVTASGTQEPVPGALVRVLVGRDRAPDAARDDTTSVANDSRAGRASGLATATDDAGRFVLRGVPAGVVRLEVRRIGYAPLVRPDVPVSPSKPADVAVALAPAVAELAAVVARPSYFPALPAPSTPVSTQAFSAEEVRRAPGGQEDVVRALSVLPGVSGASAPNQNDLIVRGGAPVENLFVVDGVEVPNINHFGTQGSTGGALSLLNIQFVREAALSAGGFGVRYGDRTSSVTDIRLRDGTPERGSRELTLSATGGSAIAQGPLGRRTTYLAGVRRSYLDLVFAALGGAGFVPRYTDATLKVTTEPSTRDRLSAFAIGAVDRFTFDNTSAANRFDNSRLIAPSQDQYFSGLTWRRSLARGAVTTTLGRTWTRFATTQADSGSADAAPTPVFVARTEEGETSLRADVVVETRGGVLLEAGNVTKYAGRLRYDVRLAGDLRRDASGAPQPLAVDTTLRAFRNATYVQATGALAPWLRLTLGARGDYYAFLGDAVRLAPRATLAATLDDRTTVTLAGGRYWQAPPTLWLAGAPGNARALRPWRADQAVLSVQRVVRPDVKVQLETYVKRYADYPARVFRPQAVLQPSGFDDATSDIPFGLEPLASAGTGRALGVEALVQKRLSEIPVFGVLALSVSDTRFRALDGRLRRGAYDAPVLANAVLGWRPNARWELSGRTRAATGLPTTPYAERGPGAGRLDFARYAAGPRLPTYFAADARVDRRFQLRGRQQLITYLDVQNVTNRRNVTRLTFNPRTAASEREANIGVFPTIGVNWEF